jgi:hypothetical protein
MLPVHLLLLSLAMLQPQAGETEAVPAAAVGYKLHQCHSLTRKKTPRFILVQIQPP